jgi:hypothetical protein
MSSPLSAILKAYSTALRRWALQVEPVAGVVAIASDEMEGLEMLGESPKGWRMILWAGGEIPKVPTNDELVQTVVRVGVSMARGLRKDAGTELTEGRGNLPPMLDVIEGVIRQVRGLYVGVGEPPVKADDCYLLRYRGWDWVKFVVGVPHFTAQINFTLDRQLSPRVPLRVEL